MEKDNKEKNPNKAKGGFARSEVLTKEKRAEIAKKAAIARWGIKATHRGNFKKDFGIDVDCYVLDDEQKTAVISQRGMGEAIGLGEGGSRLPVFIKGKKIAPFIGRELSEKLTNPLIFQSQIAGVNSPFHKVYGYDATILIDLCKSVIAAQSAGSLLKRQDGIAAACQIILNGSAKSGIKGLIYALSGYDATKEQVIAAFKLYVSEEAREYEKEFPNELYAEWYRLYELTPPARNKPWKFKHLTVEHIYWPVARSSGKVLELTRAQRAKSGSKHKKLFQFLSEIGVKALRIQLGRVQGIAEISPDKATYERNIEKAFGEQPSLPYIV